MHACGCLVFTATLKPVRQALWQLTFALDMQAIDIVGDLPSGRMRSSQDSVDTVATLLSSDLKLIWADAAKMPNHAPDLEYYDAKRRTSGGRRPRGR